MWKEIVMKVNLCKLLHISWASAKKIFYTFSIFLWQIENHNSLHYSNYLRIPNSQLSRLNQNLLNFLDIHYAMSRDSCRSSRYKKTLSSLSSLVFFSVFSNFVFRLSFQIVLINGSIFPCFGSIPKLYFFG